MNKNSILFAKLFTLIGLGIFVWFLVRGWYYENFISNEYPIHLPSAGTVGDFIGGIVGTIFTLVGIFLLYETLQFQRKELSESKKVFIKQQFDNTFFELLRNFNEAIKNIRQATPAGKKFQRQLFDYGQETMQSDFTPERTFFLNRNQALDLYQRFYVDYVGVTSVYFKTLYRIYKVISESEITEKDKISYSKILRAQLTNSELFLIRYNAMTDNGQKSIYYINKYNILKHLSHFELLEFKDWWSKLDEREKNGLGYIFKEMKEVLNALLNDESTEAVKRDFKKKRYSLRLSSESKSKFIIGLARDTSKNSNRLSIADGFDKFTSKEIENLIEGVVKELIIVSNFNRYNNRKDLKFDSNTIVNGTRTEIEVSVENLKGENLKI